MPTLEAHNSETNRAIGLKFAGHTDLEPNQFSNQVMGVYPHPWPGGGASNSGHWIWVPTLEAHNSETNRAIGLKFGGHTDLEPN